MCCHINLSLDTNLQNSLIKLSPYPSLYVDFNPCLTYIPCLLFKPYTNPMYKRQLKFCGMVVHLPIQFGVVLFSNILLRYLLNTIFVLYFYYLVFHSIKLSFVLNKSNRGKILMHNPEDTKIGIERFCRNEVCFPDFHDWE